MRITDLIEKKKLGYVLSNAEIQYLIDAYMSGEVSDYHMSAFSMAVYFRGMEKAEIAALTMAMARSGHMLDLSSLGNQSVDKHSTGGVGDKTTLIIAPLVASLGGNVAKMSGRGLGHTGGTIDKLASIPGYRTCLEEDAFIRQAQTNGICVVQAGGTLAPADSKLYALRDVTATVDSIPLIASSVMSKKIASGAKNIVLDVKTGSGALMKSLKESRHLAEIMVSIGKSCDRNVTAFITDMDTPLGNAVGNTLEVEEAIAVLCDQGPKDLKAICLRLAGEMLTLVHGGDVAYWEKEAAISLASGKALNYFKDWIRAQGGNERIVENFSLLPHAKYKMEIYAPQSGYISHIDTQKVGHASLLLGAGRSKKEDEIQMGAGVLLAAKRGTNISEKALLATLYTDDSSSFTSAKEELLSAYVFSDTPPKDVPLVYDVIR
ncbi:MAG: thymidine phosphorylase [Clostridiales bacterium]|jgi:pyrimidine-nucleoside phosphorylase|nr:thymidine phosphorylase [Clostridiales bacterium]